jgi:hypothetical protein
MTVMITLSFIFVSFGEEVGAFYVLTVPPPHIFILCVKNDTGRGYKPSQISLIENRLLSILTLAPGSSEDAGIEVFSRPGNTGSIPPKKHVAEPGEKDWVLQFHMA